MEEDEEKKVQSIWILTYFAFQNSFKTFLLLFSGKNTFFKLFLSWKYLWEEYEYEYLLAIFLLQLIRTCLLLQQKR